MPEDIPHIVHAFDLDSCAAVEEIDIGGILKTERLGWVHVDGTDPGARAWLDATLSYLDPYIVDALVAETTRPRQTHIGDGLLTILRGVNPATGSSPDDLVSIRIWLDPARIVSVGFRPLAAVDDMAAMVRAHAPGLTAGDFLAELAADLGEPIDRAVDALETRIDALEEASTHRDSTEVLTALRKQAIVMRRHLAPMRDTLTDILASPLPWLAPQNRRQIDECRNLLVRNVEDLDLIRERAQILKDDAASAMANRLNRSNLTLAVAATIFLPLTFVTGLMGMNVGGIPWANNPMGFWLSLVATGLIAILVWAVIRLGRWF